MSHLLIDECLHEAGCADGVITIISNAAEDAAELIRTMIAHPAVRRLNFAGSTTVGREIAKVAVEYLKWALLELGGPLVVLEDADIDGAVNALAWLLHESGTDLNVDRVGAGCQRQRHRR